MKRLPRKHTVPVHQRYQAHEPVLTIDPGETIAVETANHMTSVVRSEADLHPHGSPLYREREESGPICIRGAKPGGVLSIHIQQIDLVGMPHSHGRGPLVETYPQQPLLFPVEYGRCLLPGGLSTAVEPMIGDIYTTPTTPSGAHYYDCGGNMDFPEVRAGNTLYLPVQADGALLVLGDVHAFQGDGELYGEGGECAAEVTITVDLEDRYPIARPLVETPDAFIGLACRESLFESISLALKDVVRLVAHLHGVSEADAYVACTMLGSVRVAGCLSSQGATERNVLVGLSVPKDIC